MLDKIASIIEAAGLTVCQVWWAKISGFRRELKIPLTIPTYRRCQGRLGSVPRPAGRAAHERPEQHRAGDERGEREKGVVALLNVLEEGSFQEGADYN
jgi:hypothetical protein